MGNEVLQKQFISVVFGFEEDLYNAELGKEKAAELVKLEYENNDSTIDIMEKPRGSIFATLDEEMKRAKEDSAESDLAFHNKLTADIKKLKHERFVAAPRKYGHELKSKHPLGFVVRHYAADVIYDAKDWVDKNADKLSYDVYKCLAHSKDDVLIGPLFASLFADHAKGQPKLGKTVASSFRSKLHDLSQTLGACECDFVRCIKTNRLKVPNKFEPDLVLTQLGYTGMLATLKVRKLGYAMRLPYDDFMEKYQMLQPHANNTVEMLVNTIKDSGMAEKFLEELKAEGKEPPASQTRGDHIICGLKGRVLCRDWLQIKLNEARRAKIQQAAEEIGVCYVARQRQDAYERIKAIYGRIVPELHNYINKKRALDEGAKAKAAQEEAARKKIEMEKAAREEEEARMKAQAKQEKEEGKEVTEEDLAKQKEQVKANVAKAPSPHPHPRPHPHRWKRTSRKRLKRTRITQRRPRRLKETTMCPRQRTRTQRRTHRRTSSPS